MNTAVTTQQSNVPALLMSEEDLLRVIGASIYPGAAVDSIKLAIGYCKAQQLDPLQKPVHIVPMDVKAGKDEQSGKDKWVKRDVIMPGIGLYRTQASRSGCYAGKSKPSFGPTKTLTWTTEGETTGSSTEHKFEYPEWCAITIYKLVDGTVREFSHEERWIENYATAGKWSRAPNAMWTKRPYGQLAKCTEAQTLRMAFPESVGSQPTAEEMEGKHLDEFDGHGGVTVEAEVTKKEVQMPKSSKKDPSPESQATKAPNLPSTETGPAVTSRSAEVKDQTAGAGAPSDCAVEAKEETGELARPSQITIMQNKMKHKALTEVDLQARFGVNFAMMRSSQVRSVLDWLNDK